MPRSFLLVTLFLSTVAVAVVAAAVAAAKTAVVLGPLDALVPSTPQRCRDAQNRTHANGAMWLSADNTFVMRCRANATEWRTQIVGCRFRNRTAPINGSLTFRTGENGMGRMVMSCVGRPDGSAQITVSGVL